MRNCAGHGGDHEIDLAGDHLVNGEDFHLPRTVRECARHDLLIDHDLSKDVKHAGTLEFSFDMTPEWDETNGD